MLNIKDITARFELALLAMDRTESGRIFSQVSSGNTPLQAAGELVSLALENIGKGWEKGIISLSQVYLCGKFCEELVNSILPADSPERKTQPKMAIVVMEDMHALGKRIVHSALTAAGYKIADFGSGVKTGDLCNMIKKEKIEIILISVLMLPSALKIKELKTRLNDDRIKIVAGGAPFRFDKQLYTEIGADAVGYSASDAIEIIAKMAGGK